jgi:glycosyltransferase involved in cell wall biosynthesis
MERLRILLSAFACSPDRGSEAGVGWQIATRLARHHDVTVLCGDLGPARTTEESLLRYFGSNPKIPGLNIEYVGPTRETGLLCWLHGKPGLWSLYYAAYHAWQKKAFAVAQDLHSVRPFDLAHQLTYTTYREPGYLWRLPVPFFWGPIAGAADVPLSFAGVLGVRGTLAFGFRRVANAIQRRVSNRAKLAAQKAELVWTCTEAEQRLIERWGGRAEMGRDTGTVVLTDKHRTRRDSDSLEIAWSGLHVARKAMPIMLEAVARLKAKVRVTLHVLGAGPETQACREIARRLGIDGSIVWHGHLPHREALDVMGRTDVFVHSSLLEGTSSVVLEALSLALPVICHDTCGMATAINEDCGIKIPLQNPETSVSGFAQAIERIALDPQLYERLSLGALERARELTWDRKVERISEAYADAVNERQGYAEVPEPNSVLEFQK